MIFVALGEGEKGFKSVHLKMTGPSMIVLGSLLALLWVLLLVLPSYTSKSKLGRMIMTRLQGKVQSNGQEQQKYTVHKMQRGAKGMLENKAKSIEDTKDQPPIHISFEDETQGCEDQNDLGYINTTFSDDIYSVLPTSKLHTSQMIRMTSLPTTSS